MKNLLVLGKALSNLEQQQVNGGGKKFGPVTCVSPYFTADNTCIEGYHLHPQGHCICCRD